MEILPTWLFFALGFSFLATGLRATNEYFKVNGHALVFWRGLLPALCMIPMAFMNPWPTNPVFYFAVLTTIPIVTFIDSIHFEASRKFGAGVPSRLLPTGILITFIGWLIIKPEQIDAYLANPVWGIAIILSLGSIVFFASRLRHCEVSRSAFIFMLPVVLSGGIVTMLNKTAMDNSGLHQGVWFYILLQGTGVAVMAVLRDKLKKRSIKKLFSKELIKAGMVICFFTIAGTAFKGYGLAMVDNPAYFAAVGMLSPFWIICLYKIIGRKEDGIDVISGLFLVSSVIALVLFKGML